MPGARLTKNSQRHDQLSVIQPPTTGPRVGASEARPPITEAAITRCLPWKKKKAEVKTVGIIAPPRKPCRARKMIIDWMFQAPPHNRLASVNPAEDRVNSQRVDS